MEIIKWDEEKIKVLPKLFGILQSSLHSDRGVVYGIIDNERLNILARDGHNVIYINNQGDKVDVSSYVVDDNYKIQLFAIGDKEYGYLGERVNVVDKTTNIEESLLLVDMSDDDMDGLVTYTQLNRNTDVECEIQFEHRYFKGKDDERGHIYDYRLADISSLMIDEHSTTNPRERGLVGKGHEYFTKLAVDDSFIDYYLVALKENGLMEYFRKGAINLLGSDHIIRYVKGWYIGRDGNFKALWPVGKAYKEDEMLELIEKYGFKTSVSSELVDLYNGNNEFVNKIQSLLLQVKELEKNKDDERRLVYKIHP